MNRPTASAGAYRTGETGLIIKVSEAESAVGAWRGQFDSAAAAGVPAHITVLYPFLPYPAVDAAVLAELTSLFATHQAFDLQLSEARRFPGVLYLAPEPAAALRALTDAVVSTWPEAPPYGGRFADVVPHLTVADSQEPHVLDVIESEVSAQLPIAARVASVQLITYSGGCWTEVRSFSLANND